jgi:translocator protein
MNRWLSLLGFLILINGGGLAIGDLTAPGEWYAGLAKPVIQSAELDIGPGLDGARD